MRESFLRKMIIIRRWLKLSENIALLAKNIAVFQLNPNLIFELRLNFETVSKFICLLAKFYFKFFILINYVIKMTLIGLPSLGLFSI